MIKNSPECSRCGCGMGRGIFNLIVCTRVDIHYYSDSVIFSTVNSVVYITKEQVDCVEKETRGQSTNRLWFQFRLGRITSLVMRRVCHTDIKKPSQSLIMQVCYPARTKFSNAATQWGCCHEKKALKVYTNVEGSSHDNFKVTECGFFIRLDFPYLGSSPDAIVECDCCGKGCVEIKCPYCIRDQCIVRSRHNYWLPVWITVTLQCGLKKIAI